VAVVLVAESGGALPLAGVLEAWLSFAAWMMSPVAAYGSCEMMVRVSGPR
jgi:hypothetical protein